MLLIRRRMISSGWPFPTVNSKSQNLERSFIWLFILYCSKRSPHMCLDLLTSAGKEDAGIVSSKYLGRGSEESGNLMFILIPLPAWTVPCSSVQLVWEHIQPAVWCSLPPFLLWRLPCWLWGLKCKLNLMGTNYSPLEMSHLRPAKSVAGQRANPLTSKNIVGWMQQADWLYYAMDKQRSVCILWSLKLLCFHVFPEPKGFFSRS